jgi:hypothetical protein
MPENSKLKVVQTVVDVLKNLVLLVVLGYAAVEGRSALSTIFTQISSGERVASEVSIGSEGVKVKLEEAKQSLTAALKAQTKTEGTKDQPVTPQNKDVLGALEQTDRALTAVTPTAAAPAVSPRWVYLGIEKSGTWNPNYFHLTAQPTRGISITATTDVYERDNQPVYDQAIKDWKLGNTVGILREGQAATVLDVAHEEADNGGNNWWARIR